LKPYQARGSDRGFTLVELLVGVVVSGLVALFLFWMVAQDARFKALERARAGVRDKVQLAIDLFQEDFRGIESTDGLEARPGSFYVQSDKGLLTLNWGVRFKRWLYLSESGRPGFQPLWVVWGAKQGSRPDPYWTLYRIVHREAYGRMIEVSRLELKPLTRAELHLFGLNERAEPGPGALVRLDKTYPYSVPSGKLERLAYAELEIDALAQTGASQRMLGTFGQNYRPSRFIARAQPRNIDAAFINPKPLSGV
jgi:prepilin-type N-terminal cleavage/methylation domain-containing protein